MRLLVPTLLCATCLSSCTVAGEWTGRCDELPVETELEESDENPHWTGSAAASRMIHAADAERLDGELLMLRPSPF